MKHLTDGTLQAYLDDELPVPERSAVEAHLAACGGCGSELAALERAGTVFASAMGRLPEPTVALLEARAGVARRSRAAARTREPVLLFGWSLARAALLLLGLAAVASATIPGSPLRRWIEELLADATVAPAEAPAIVEAPAAPAPPMAEVSVAPEQGRVRVTLLDLPADASVRVRLVDGDRAAVLAMGGAAGARFTTGPGRIEVRGPTASGGEVLVQLPRSALRAEVLVDGRPYLVKDGAAVRLLAPAADTTGSEILFRPGS
jgi:hypothetical protein